MALLKLLEIPGTGLFADYCRITHVAVDFTATREFEGRTLYGVAEVIVHAYADEAARIAGKDPATLRRLEFTSSDLDLENLSRSILYTALKATPDFDGAEDA